MIKKIILTSDNFYTSPELINHANGSARPLVMCDVTNEWYIANVENLPAHSEVIEDAETLVITNKNL